MGVRINRRHVRWSIWIDESTGGLILVLSRCFPRLGLDLNPNVQYVCMDTCGWSTRIDKSTGGLILVLFRCFLGPGGDLNPNVQYGSNWISQFSKHIWLAWAPTQAQKIQLSFCLEIWTLMPDTAMVLGTWSNILANTDWFLHKLDAKDDHKNKVLILPQCLCGMEEQPSPLNLSVCNFLSKLHLLWYSTERKDSLPKNAASCSQKSFGHTAKFMLHFLDTETLILSPGQKIKAYRRSNTGRKN